MNYYDRIAQGYDELHRDEQMKKLNIILEQLQLEKNQSLLDVGCGTGFSLDCIHAKFGCEVFGIELSPGMVAQYKGAHQIICAPAEHIPFADESFDAVISLTAIQNFDNISKGIVEMIRVAKSKSFIIISCLKRSVLLKNISEMLADLLEVRELIEEEKDIIFVCRRKL